MYRIMLFAAFLAISIPAHAQSEQLITVSAQAVVEVPADRLHFNITIGAEAPAAQKAYALHREREGQLVELLKNHEIAEKNIRFQPVSIRPYRPSRNQPRQVRTRQQVQLTLKDFELYEKIQLTLIEGGFDEFSGNFTSTELEEGKNKAIRKAVQKAKEDAALITEEAGIELLQIKGIQYNSSGIIRQRRDVQLSAASMESPGSLVDNFGQTVPVRASITIEFFIRS